VTAQHFLVPTDFSPYADQALAEAIDLAHAVDAQITLLHVLQLMPLTVGDVPPEYFSDYLEAIEIEAQRHMQASLNRIYQAGLQADSAITQGIPFQAIVEMAGEKKADLIIMGTQGRTGLPHLLIGSVAEKVVRLAPCPVLVARQKQAAPSA
jgi:nucleotide-binding universal stress UspA family protein